MFIERANSKRSSRASGAKREPEFGTIAGNIALRWSAGRTHNRFSINIWLRWSPSTTWLRAEGRAVESAQTAQN